MQPGVDAHRGRYLTLHEHSADGRTDGGVRVRGAEQLRPQGYYVSATDMSEATAG